MYRFFFINNIYLIYLIFANFDKNKLNLIHKNYFIIFFFRIKNLIFFFKKIFIY